MGKRKFLVREESIGILILVFVTAFAGYMGVSKKFNENITKNKVRTQTKEYSGNNKNYYYDTDDYDEYDDDDNELIYTGNYSYDYYYEENKNYYYTGDDSYKYEGYKDYNGTYNYSSSIYNDKEAPSVKYSRSDIIYQYSSYDPWKNISAYHSKLGDVTDYIEITYNNLDVNIPGNYSIVYKACNYPGSSYCRTVTRTVTVKQKTGSNTNNSNNNINSNINYSKGPVWSNYSDKTCTQGNTSCNTYNITKPTAKDPYTNKKLDVSLISGNIDVYTPGTYVLVYYATTEHNISGTITKRIIINKSSSNNYDDDYNYIQSKKYISNYTTSYYDDGQYRGYLNADNNGERISKYISNYKWTNKVSYTYRCDNKNQYGTNGWTYIRTNTSDDNPTYYYNVGGFTGTLNKTDFYCVEGSGCEYDLNKNLGTCTNVGEYKTVYRTWVGLYSGYVYANQKQTYSGYVYSYR